jgi:hypothetical protein
MVARVSPTRRLDPGRGDRRGAACSRGFDPRSTRVGLVAFAGDPPGYDRDAQAAVTIGELTREYRQVEHELEQLQRFRRSATRRTWRRASIRQRSS